MRDDWIILFKERINTISLVKSPSNVIYNDRIIIDHILLFSNHIPTILRYFSCVAQEFIKYRLSFKLRKRDFFKPRVEYIGHYFTTDGNCPVVSKLFSFQDRPLPPHVIFLLSFIGLCWFYYRYCSWSETNIRSLRKLQRTYNLKDVPIFG